MTRPALALERLRQNSTGQVVYELKTPYRDGTMRVVFEPMDIMVKFSRGLAGLVPRPRANLIRTTGYGTFVGNECQASR